MLYISEMFQWHGVAVDINPTACEVTRTNAELHHVSDRLTVYRGDINTGMVQSRVLSQIR